MGYETNTAAVRYEIVNRSGKPCRLTVDPDSVFHYYRKLIELRKQYDIFRDGSFTLLCPEDEKIFAYTRDTRKGHMLVAANFSSETLPFEIPEEYKSAEKLIGNYAGMGDQLRPYEAMILYYEKIC